MITPQKSTRICSAAGIAKAENSSAKTNTLSTDRLRSIR